MRRIITLYSHNWLQVSRSFARKEKYSRRECNVSE